MDQHSEPKSLPGPVSDAGGPRGKAGGKSGLVLVCSTPGSVRGQPLPVLGAAAHHEAWHRLGARLGLPNGRCAAAAAAAHGRLLQPLRPQEWPLPGAQPWPLCLSPGQDPTFLFCCGPSDLLQSSGSPRLVCMLFVCDLGSATGPSSHVPAEVGRVCLCATSPLCPCWYKLGSKGTGGKKHRLARVQIPTPPLTAHSTFLSLSFLISEIKV